MPRKTGGALKTPKKKIGTRRIAAELDRQEYTVDDATALWRKTAERLDQHIREMRAGDYSSLVEPPTVIDRVWRDDLDFYSKNPDAYQAGVREGLRRAKQAIARLIDPEGMAAPLVCHNQLKPEQRKKRRGSK
jgi:hypothetical protein